MYKRVEEEEERVTKKKTEEEEEGGEETYSILDDFQKNSIIQCLDNIL